MNSQDYKTLHEANWLSTLIAEAGDASGSKFLKKVAVSIDEKIQNGGNTYSPTAIKGNIAESLLGTEATVISASTEASMTVKYKNGTEMTLSSSTDSFSLEGLTIKVNETFTAGDPVTLS